MSALSHEQCGRRELASTHFWRGQLVHLNLVATKFAFTTLRHTYFLLSNTELNLLKREVTFTFPLEMSPEM
jgi:hypothetical protein